LRPLRFDYGCRVNGTRDSLQAVALARDPAQAEVLALYGGLAARNMAKGHLEFPAMTEAEPDAATRATSRGSAVGTFHGRTAFTLVRGRLFFATFLSFRELFLPQCAKIPIDASVGHNMA
jgi:hypothetical protein